MYCKPSKQSSKSLLIEPICQNIEAKQIRSVYQSFKEALTIKEFHAGEKSGNYSWN